MNISLKILLIMALMMGSVGTAAGQDVDYVATDFGVDNPSKYDTTIMTEPKTCVPNEVRTSGQNVYQCKSDGSGEDLLISCAGDERLVLGMNTGDGLSGYSCEERSGNGVLDIITLGTIALMLVALIVKSVGGFLKGLKDGHH